MAKRKTHLWQPGPKTPCHRRIGKVNDERNGLRVDCLDCLRRMEDRQQNMSLYFQMFEETTPHQVYSKFWSGELSGKHFSQMPITVRRYLITRYIRPHFLQNRISGHDIECEYATTDEPQAIALKVSWKEGARETTIPTLGNICDDDSIYGHRS